MIWVMLISAEMRLSEVDAMIAPTGAATKKNIEAEVIEKSIRDQHFRERLLLQPKAAIEHEFGIALPKSLNIRVVEDDEMTLYLVLPLRNADRLAALTRALESSATEDVGVCCPCTGWPTNSTN